MFHRFDERCMFMVTKERRIVNNVCTELNLNLGEPNVSVKQNRLQIIAKFGGHFSCLEILFSIQVQF